jgi:hypothetical protein
LKIYNAIISDFGQLSPIENRSCFFISSFLLSPKFKFPHKIADSIQESVNLIFFIDNVNEADGMRHLFGSCGEEQLNGPVHINKDPVLGLQLLEDPSKPQNIAPLKTCLKHLAGIWHFFHEFCLSSGWK